MGEWKEYKLGDIAEINMGQSPESKYYNDIGIGLPFLQGNRTFGLRFPSFDTFCSDPKKIANEGEILFSVRAPVGDINIATTKICIGRGLASLNAKNGNNNFLFYLLHFLKNIIINTESGTVFGSVNRNDLETIELLIPDEMEQKSIAAILSSLDDKIDLLHRQNKTLEALAETLFRQWFVEEAEGWEEKQLSELMTITSSKRIFYSEYVNYGIPFYRSKEIIELRSSGSTNSELFISKERFNEIKKKFDVPKSGDILLTSVGTLGVPFRVRGNDEFYFKDGNLTWFKDFKEISSAIIYFWLLSIIGQEQIRSITIGSTQEAITIDGLKRLKLTLPPKDLLLKYEAEFESIHFKIESNQNQIRTLTRLRDTLLPQLMAGGIRVKNVDRFVEA